MQTFTKMPRSNMASVNIVIAWIVMCLVLFGAALRKDPNAKACAFAKPCICFGTKVDCKNRSLRMIPEGIPRNTTHLDLSVNQLTTLDMTKLSRLTKLRVLLLHKNQLREVPPWQALPSSLQRLWLHQNLISVVPSQRLTKKMSLAMLSLNNNNISVIEPYAFANLTSIWSLKLGRNKLEAIPVAALSQVTGLEILDLTKNSIREIRVRLSQSIKSVSHLKLSKNKIYNISAFAFWEMEKMQELHLDNNNLTSISKTWFFGVPMLRILNFDNNRIRVIEESKMPGVNWKLAFRLQILILANNEFTHIYSTTFAHLKYLRRLILNTNRIHYLADEAFSDLLSLQTLDLRYNALPSTALEGGVFANLNSVWLVRLDGNRITRISANSFHGLTNAISMNLSANAISSIDRFAFYEMTSLQYLYFDTEKLICNCEIKWLPTWLREKNIQDDVRGLCSYPENLAGRSILNISLSNLECDNSGSSPEVIKHPQGKKVLLGQNVTLRCVVSWKNYSITVNWTKNGRPLKGAHLKIHTQSKDDYGGAYTSELHLTSVSRRDSGKYQCVAYSPEFVPVRSHWAQLSVLGFPKLTQTPTDVIVEPGKTFKLYCKAQGYPVPTLLWQKDGGRSFPAADDRRIKYAEGLEVCEIRNAQYNDSGKYTCFAKNVAGSANASATVTVLEPPGFTGSWRKEVTVSAGDSLVLECYVTGAPQPLVIWFKDGNKIQMNKHVVLTESRQLLVITKATDDDGGRYDCEVANSQGNDTRTMMVAIEPEKCTGVVKKSNSNNSNYVKYDKKTFLGIIVVVVVACIVVTSMVWLFIQYNTLSCGKRRAPRRSLHTGPFGVDYSDESNSKALNQEISYIPLKLSSSSSTQTSRESPRSTATFLTASESAQGRCAVATLAGCSSENASGSEEKSSGNDNISSENSLKESRSSLASFCRSESSLPCCQEVVTSAQVHGSDSDSEKSRPTLAMFARNTSCSDHDPGEHKLTFPDCIPYNKKTCTDHEKFSSKDVTPDVCVTFYPPSEKETSCDTDVVESTLIVT